MFEILTLKHPWLRAEDGELLPAGDLKQRSDRMSVLVRVPERILSGPRPKVSRLRPVPEELDAVIERALAPNPGDRHRTVGEFWEEFSHTLNLWGHTTTLRRIAWAEETPVEETRPDQTRTVQSTEETRTAPAALRRVGRKSRPKEPIAVAALLAVLLGTAAAVVALGLGGPPREPVESESAAPSIAAISATTVRVSEPSRPIEPSSGSLTPETEHKPEAPTARPKKLRREAPPAQRAGALAPTPKSKRADLVEVERALAAARAHPNDGALLRELGDRVIEAAGRLEDLDRAASIRRRAAAAVMVFELAGLEGCVRDLESGR
jgi:hypothetical protein